jgi:hypothetical protein
MSTNGDLDKQYSDFVAKLSGYVVRYAKAHHKRLNAVAQDCYLTPQTLYNLTQGRTRNPNGYTVWKILRYTQGRKL